jgi:hypothetical protein
MTAPDAHLVLRLGSDASGQSEVLLLGNRSGLLSLANILLWLRATSWRRELLSLGQPPGRLMKEQAQREANAAYLKAAELGFERTS